MVCFQSIPYVCWSLSLDSYSCGDRNCSRRATVGLGIDTLIANILVSSYIIIIFINRPQQSSTAFNGFLRFTGLLWFRCLADIRTVSADSWLRQSWYQSYNTWRTVDRATPLMTTTPTYGLWCDCKSKAADSRQQLFDSLMKKYTTNIAYMYSRRRKKTQDTPASSNHDRNWLPQQHKNL